MPTISQLVRKGRKSQKPKVDTPALRTTWHYFGARFFAFGFFAP